MSRKKRAGGLRDCMKKPQARANRLTMRRLMAAYTNASPLAHNLS
jgi:hypothetical protein